MNFKSIIAGVVGGVAYWLAGYLFYVLLLGSYFVSNHGAGVKEPYDMWAIVVGCIFFGLLLALIFDRWANISVPKSGAIAGATIGLLTGLSWNFVRFGDSTFFTNLTAGLVDSLVVMAMASIAGTVVALLLGVLNKD